MSTVTAVPPDCEIPDTWFFDQDVNTWSSFVYVAVGLGISSLVIRRGYSRWFHLLGLAAAVEGIGSVLFHGGSTRGGQFVHDVGIFWMAGFIASWQFARLLTGSDAQTRGRAVGAGVAIVLALTVPAWWISSDSTNIVVAVLVAAILGSELLARRRGLGGIWSAALVGSTLLAGITWGLGHSDSPLCAPESPLQPHAVWHVLSALVVLAWFDRALEVDDRMSAPRLYRRAIDRIFGFVARGVVRTFHRSVETMGRTLPSDRPVLIVANHGNGFVDPVVVAAAIGRLPRFLAKAALWKVPVARPFLGLAGALPVYRRSDGDDVTKNRSVFAAAHDELSRCATVAIFPEGTTGDRAHLDRVKSGAARIALGAISDAPDLVIVPIGLAFETRYETRSRVVVEFGEPIDVAPHHHHPSDGAEPDHDDVRELTDVITRALEGVSPQFHTVEDRDTFRATARIASAAETGRATESFAAAERVARRLGRASDDDRRRVRDVFDEYARRLTAAQLVDRDVAARRAPLWRIVASTVALLVGGSFVLSATLVHLPALIVVVAATSAVHATATKGTVRALVGLVAGLATWLIAGVVVADGWAALVAAAVFAASGVIALLVWSPLLVALRTLQGRLRCLARGSGLDELFDARNELAATVDEVLRHEQAERPSTNDETVSR